MFQVVGGMLPVSLILMIDLMLLNPYFHGTIIRTGAPVTPFLRFGDSFRIEMKDAEGRSIFGAIEQEALPHAE